ncbi:hypothetical protein MPNT_430002 [Candidatus Methylacidithermus pantelleriae]|uniref:Uncharacterized protein n=1 Tax=Candidatus Methylacidithermus pantelleriae TaxID=2744239 RepID=A0A8J2BVA1_9BACT|nr:hypothetical protein MPNT_430002 [Candidatus Methylacidithermus pantelleriae]
MNPSTIFSLFVLAFLIQVPGCFSHNEKSGTNQPSTQPSRGIWPSLPLLKQPKHCDITDQDRFILTYVDRPMHGPLNRMYHPPLTLNEAKRDFETYRNREQEGRLLNRRLVFVKHVDCSEITKMFSVTALGYDPGADPDIICCVEVKVEADYVTPEIPEIHEPSHRFHVPNFLHYLAGKNRMSQWIPIYGFDDTDQRIQIQ